RSQARVKSWKPTDRSSLALSATISVVILSFFLIVFDDCQHWFVIPVLACGILIGVDFMDWARGRMNLMDPVRILGVLGFLNFFFAPLLPVALDSWIAWITPPPDWREWLGKMAIVDFAGLLVYRIVCRLGVPASAKTPLRLWRITHPAAVVLIALAA